MDVISNSEAETQKIAENISNTLQNNDILLLSGDLGAGKSVFARALLRILAKNPALDVPSPTYTLLQTYDTPMGKIAHFDLYRLKTPDEIYELGWEDTLSEGISIIEWPERLGHLKPSRYIDISITTVENTPNARKIKVIKHGYQ